MITSKIDIKVLGDSLKWFSSERADIWSHKNSHLAIFSVCTFVDRYLYNLQLVNAAHSTQKSQASRKQISCSDKGNSVWNEFCGDTESTGLVLAFIDKL